jgi:hypothetical protein
MPTPAEILAQYEKLQLEPANEAETRPKVINDVLYSVLGWTHSDVKVEERVSSRTMSLSSRCFRQTVSRQSSPPRA